MSRFRPRIFRPRYKAGRRVARRWTAQLGDGEVMSTTVMGNSELVLSTDYASNTALEPDGPMLARMRGSITIDSTVITAYTAWMAIFLLDASIASATPGSLVDPSVIQNLITEDVLWWHHVRFGARSVATNPDRAIIELDIKAKRKLKDKHVLLVWIATNAGAAGTQGTLSHNVRSLLVGNSAT